MTFKNGFFFFMLHEFPPPKKSFTKTYLNTYNEAIWNI